LSYRAIKSTRKKQASAGMWAWWVESLCGWTAFHHIGKAVAISNRQTDGYKKKHEWRSGCAVKAHGAWKAVAVKLQLSAPIR